MARSLLAAAAAGVLVWPGMVASRAVPVVDAAAPTTAPSSAAVRSSALAARASDDPVSAFVDDLRPGGLPRHAGGVVAAAQSATVRAVIGPVQRPPATASPGRRVEPRGVQAVLAAAYEQAAHSAPARCRLRAADLAAIGQIESGSLGGRQLVGHRVVPAVFGPLLDGGPFAVVRDTDGGRYDGSAQFDRAVGPMQFLPGTWAWAGRDGDGDGIRDPQNVFDASFAAAAYLCRAGRDLSQPAELRAAFWSYNQSSDYVSAALAWVSYFERNGLGALGAVRISVASGGRASDLGPRPTAVTATPPRLTLLPASRTAASPVASSTSVPTPATTTTTTATTAVPAPTISTATPPITTTTAPESPTPTTTATTPTSVTETATPPTP